MSGNLFKNHSINAIEECIAKALGELVGKPVTVTLDGLEVKGVSNGTAKFNVDAYHAGEPVGEDDFPF